MGELQKRGRVLDADIHRELTVEEANKERTVWTKEKVTSDEVYIKLSDVEEMKKDFSTTEEIQMQLTMLSQFVTNKSVLKGLQEHLTKEYKAVWKWLADEQP